MLFLDTKNFLKRAFIPNSMFFIGLEVLAGKFYRAWSNTSLTLT